MLKRAIVRLLGRERANRASAPFYDWQARRHTQRNLATLASSDLCINLGCGPSALAGWVNVDIARGPGIDVVWDLRRALPFADESCTAIFSEHVIEHLLREDAEQLLRECHRILQKGGVLRLSTPDAGRYLRSYAGDGEFLRHPNFPQAVETPIDRINIMMREGGQHLWVYDSDSLLLLLRRVGFTSATEEQFGISRHPRMQSIDLESRAFESLYVEAVK
jgi:predicted SAM-dependent methyltransferase